MKFKPELPEAPVSAKVLEQDFSQAAAVGRIHLGDQYLFLKKFSGATYLPYDRITRAWLRQEEVRARMCCATANFDQFYVVLACTDGQERRGQVEDKAAGQRCLDHIAAKHPAVKIGYQAP